jgi:hypothetical protein
LRAGIPDSIARITDPRALPGTAHGSTIKTKEGSVTLLRTTDAREHPALNKTTLAPGLALTAAARVMAGVVCLKESTVVPGGRASDNILDCPVWVITDSRPVTKITVSGLGWANSRTKMDIIIISS